MKLRYDFLQSQRLVFFKNMSIEIVNPENFVAKTLARITATLFPSLEGLFEVGLTDEEREQIQGELQAELEASLATFASDEDEKPKSKKVAPKGKSVAKKGAPKAKPSTKTSPAKKAAAKAKTTAPKAVAKATTKAKKSAPKDYSTMKVEDLKAELTARDLIKTGKKDDLIARLEAHDAGGEDAPKPKTAAKKVVTKAKAKEVKPSGPVAQENAWGNSEEPDSGLIFVMLPVGTGGRQVPVAVGIQNAEAAEDAMGLASVLPLTEDMIEECNKQKWRFLSDEYMATLEELGHEMYGELAEVRARGGGDAEEVDGEEVVEDDGEVVEDDGGVETEDDVEEEE